jgi:hypothetical protein
MSRCNRTSRRVARKASRLMHARSGTVRSVAASALSQRRRSPRPPQNDKDVRAWGPVPPARAAPDRRHAERRTSAPPADAVQAAGRVPIDVRKVATDHLSLSGHKFLARKGIGARDLSR